MNVAIWGWDTPNKEWVKMLVDASGHLQVDVLSTVMDASAATEATLADVESAVDGIEGLLGAGLDAPFAITNDWLSRINAKVGKCYGWIGDVWYHLLVETAANPNLRVALYGADSKAYIGASSAAFTYATPGLQTFATLYGDDGTNVSRVGMLLDGADAVDNALNTLGVASMLYGYNEVSWDRLRMESDALHNLRVKLYTGADEIYTPTWLTTLGPLAGKKLLGVAAGLYVQRTAGYFDAVKRSSDLADNDAGHFSVPVSLRGYDGSKWDRLRTWGLGVLEVGRAEIDSTTVRHTAAGAVVAGAHNLYWVACSPDSPAAEWELSDDTDGLSTAVYDHFDSDKHSEHLVFDPPMKFAKGIYIKKFDHMHSLVFCYV